MSSKFRRYRWVQNELKMIRRDLSSVMSLLQRSPIALSSPCHFGMSDSHLLAGNFPASRRIKLRASLRLNRRGRTAKVARHTALQFLGQNARWRRQRAELQNQCPTIQIDPAQIIIEGSAAYLHLDDRIPAVEITAHLSALRGKVLALIVITAGCVINPPCPYRTFELKPYPITFCYR
jgi:hypothetical protein